MKQGVEKSGRREKETEGVREGMRQAKRNSFHNYFKVPKQSFLSLCLCCICPMGAALIENAAAN